jgi:hypothetical protein
VTDVERRCLLGMDPLSAAASVIALVDLTRHILSSLNFVKRLQDAPNDLLSLQAEIARLEDMLQSLAKELSDDRSPLVQTGKGQLEETSKDLISPMRETLFQLQQITKE